MLTMVRGVYRNGRIELSETPGEVRDEAQVLVTFLPVGDVDLSAQGIDPEQAAELRARLASFTEDWDQPEMDVYDTYDAARSRL